MKKILAALALSLMACGGELAISTEDEPAASMIEEANVASDSSALSTQSCYQEWWCNRCGLYNRYNRNVLYEICPDGSRTAIYTGPCGEACY